MQLEGMVSIVTPVYNVAGYIEDTIRSVLSQTYAGWEWILVDDHSGDESTSIIEKYLSDERIRLIKLDKNSGAANARNEGIRQARGRYLAFLDADDIWLPKKLEKQLEFIKEKEAAFTYTSYEFGDVNADPTGRIVKVLPELNYRKALSRTIVFTTTVLFDLDLIPKDKVMMKSIPSEDTATWWRIMREGYTAYGLLEVLAIYRRPESSLSSNKVNAIKRIWNLYRKEENLGIVSSVFYFIFWALRATIRRL